MNTISLITFGFLALFLIALIEFIIILKLRESNKDRELAIKICAMHMPMPEIRKPERREVGGFHIERPKMLFSARAAVDKEFQDYCNESGAGYYIVNFMAFAEKKGWINSEEVLKSVRERREAKKSILEIRAEKRLREMRAEAEDYWGKMR